MSSRSESIHSLISSLSSPYASSPLHSPHRATNTPRTFPHFHKVQSKREHSSGCTLIFFLFKQFKKSKSLRVYNRAKVLNIWKAFVLSNTRFFEESRPGVETESRVKLASPTPCTSTISAVKEENDPLHVYLSYLLTCGPWNILLDVEQKGLTEWPKLPVLLGMF